MKSELAVLLIDAEEQAATLREALQGGQVPAIQVQHAGTLARALEMLDSGAFDAVIVELDLPDSKGYETFARLKSKQPNAALLVLTSSEDEELALRTLRAGAEEHVTRGDLSGKALRRRVRHAVERRWARMPREARVLSFIGSKGGVGTTTTVLNVAAAMLTMGKSVIAAEMHPDFGSFATQLILTPSRTLPRLLEPATVNAQDVQESVFKLPSGLQILFGPQTADEFRADIDAEKAVQVLKACRSMADVILLDLPAGPSAANAALVHASNFTVFVLERERAAFESLVAHLPLLESWTPAQRAVGALVVNRISFVESISLDEILRRLKCGFLGTVPPAAETLAVRGTGAPLVMARPELGFSQALMEIADRLAADPVRFFAA